MAIQLNIIIIIIIIYLRTQAGTSGTNNILLVHKNNDDMITKAVRNSFKYCDCCLKVFMKHLKLLTGLFLHCRQYSIS